MSAPEDMDALKDAGASGELAPCPRCEDGTADVVARSPVPGVWEVFQCVTCLYMWRSTEPDRRTRREHYPAEFRMRRIDIDTAPEVPTIPPLKTDT